ncbi:hypothetical protein ACHWQZ_G015091 [Mnemiopsis leidyi]
MLSSKKKKKKKRKIVVSLVSDSSSTDDEPSSAKTKMGVHAIANNNETRIVPSKPNNIKSDEGMMSVEDYSSKILEEVGPKHWLQHLMKELDSAGPMSKHTNVAIEIIRNFPVIVFTSTGNKNGKKSIQLLEECRRRHNVHENSVLEIFIDDTRAGNKTYNDLVAVTKDCHRYSSMKSSMGVMRTSVLCTRKRS